MLAKAGGKVGLLGGAAGAPGGGAAQSNLSGSVNMKQKGKIEANIIATQYEMH
jgi:hypothetical protein